MLIKFFIPQLHIKTEMSFVQCLNVDFFVLYYLCICLTRFIETKPF